jgi:hypothetical protein
MSSPGCVITALLSLKLSSQLLVIDVRTLSQSLFFFFRPFICLLLSSLDRFVFSLVVFFACSVAGVVVVLVSMATACFSCGKRQSRWQMKQRKLLNGSSQNNRSEGLSATEQQGGTIQIIEIKKLLENISEILIYEKMRPISSNLGLNLLFSCNRITDNKFSNLYYRRKNPNN